MTTFTPIQSLFGGVLIGTAVLILLLFLGRIAGTSGIIGSLLPPRPASDKGWRIAFLIGLLVAATILQYAFGFSAVIQNVASTPLLLIGGFVVGIGVTLASGCTSGHAVCGLARLSKRSLYATITFMLSTAITVFIIKHIIG